MTTSLPHRANGQSGVAKADGTQPRLNYSKVQAYWKSAQPSLLGPYMMNGFGFPTDAGWFRYRGELSAVTEAVKNLPPSTSVLDLGSGVGIWTEYFAQRFAKVMAVEASSTLYEALKHRCSRYPNVTTHNRDVLSFEPQVEQSVDRGFGLVFLGGLLMYLNDHDIRTLLHKLIPYLKPNALILCRESTIRRGVQSLHGDYQVVYRSVEAYRNILTDAGLDIVSVKPNAAYFNVQMACEVIKKWKAMMPDRLHFLPVVGRFSYWGFRLGYPWNTRLIPWLLAKLGRDFPLLTNHFFVLKPSLQAVADQRNTSMHNLRTEKERFETAR